MSPVGPDRTRRLRRERNGKHGHDRTRRRAHRWRCPAPTHRTTYLPSGLTDYANTFAASSGGAAAEIALHPTYAATGVHPAIFPTVSIANYVDGTFDPAAPDTDVISSATYDPWGRTLTSTDPDGVQTESHYAVSGNGIATDIDWTEDGLNNRTTATYDLVGNQLGSTSPLGRTTATTYDLAGHVIRTTAPDGVVSENDYDNFGLLKTAWANYVDGTPGTGSATDDVKTTYAYDTAGRPTSTIANDGGGTAQAKTATTYDLLGRATSTTVYATFDGTAFGGERKTESHPQVDLVRNITRPGIGGTRGPGTSSMSGPLVPTASPAPFCPDSSSVRCNAITERDLNGLPIGVTDAYGKVSRTYQDLAGRTVFAIANFGDGVYSSGSPDVDIVSVSQYDIGGRIVRTVDVLGRARKQTFDALGRSVQSTSYDSAATATTKTPPVRTRGMSGPTNRFAPNGQSLMVKSRSRRRLDAGALESRTERLVREAPGTPQTEAALAGKPRAPTPPLGHAPSPEFAGLRGRDQATRHAK
jgi:YD repeat-containing protein